MEDAIDLLARRLLSAADSVGAREKVLVGIAGVPGSGKSTTAASVAARINELQRAKGELCAAAVGMDGFHLYRSQLDAMPNAAEAHARRGAHWTFDAHAFVDAVRQLCSTGEVLLPSFDHAVGDPVPDDVHIRVGHRIVLIEGNYLLLDTEPWRELRELFDETWYIDCDCDVAMQRVYERQVSIGVPAETARHRVDTNDRLNAEQISETALFADIIVPSLPYRTPCPTA